MRIAFVTSQVSPFQAELAEAINRHSGVQYTVVFCSRRNLRPPHWLAMEDRIQKQSVTVPPDIAESRVQDWALGCLNDLKPDVIIAGGVRGVVPNAAFQYRRSKPSTLIGLWMEPPLPVSNRIISFAKGVEYKYRLSKADFILAIGDRAESFYRQCNGRTTLVPYGEDLSICLNSIKTNPVDEPIRFLFSGGLHARHNFPIIMESFRKLIDERGTRFEFVISGDGPEQRVIDRAMSDDPRLNTVVRYDRVFSNWNDRLRPFCESDVFVYPTNHAGWGLVVPEAMAAGQLVISTEGAEAARHLIENEKNGLIIRPTVPELSRAFIRCFDNRPWVQELGREARVAAVQGHAPNVAKKVINAIIGFLQSAQITERNAA